MRYRSSRTLVFHPDGTSFVGCNFLTKSVFECDPDLPAFLQGLGEWYTLGEILAQLPSFTEDELRETLDALVAMSAVLVEGSDIAAKDEDFIQHWKWGVPAALLHFCVQDPDFMSMGEAEDLQRAALVQEGEVALYLEHTDASHPIALPDPLGGNDLLQFMAKRRTRRDGQPKAVKLADLSNCLFAGMGITGKADNSIVTLPLSMTPSGGARNPYEAYVFVKSVEGLVPGIYHYSARGHTLAKIEGDVPSLSLLTGGQDWVDTMPCLIVLCAFMDRTMWKYTDANAYRVVMIEAGHIGQNIMLAATQKGMTACPTAALNHSLITNSLHIHNLTHAPIYALALGWYN